MPSLSEKLKSLGVNIGTKDLKPPQKIEKYPIENIIDGKEIDNPLGRIFVVENRYKKDPRIDTVPLVFSASLATISTWLGNPEFMGFKPQSFVFLDTETSGLAGGTGTYAFMIGIGKFVDDEFHLSQYFMRDLIEEPAHLAALSGALEGCKVLVTYNGKSFDVPLLNSRYITNGEPPLLKSYLHIDLLHLTRRLWRDRLPSRTLGSIEENILNVQRTEQDIPGWMVPSIYFDYLQTGDARPLLNVFYHNAMDIISLAALLNHISSMFNDPHGGLIEHGIDLIAMGKIFEEMSKFDAAAECYAHGLEFDIPDSVRGQAIKRWSIMEKRRNNLSTSMQLWQKAAEYEEVYAHIELAKAFEHKLKNFTEAIYWTEQAISIVQSPDFPDLERNMWFSRLEHRLNRLIRKSGLPIDK